MFHNFEKHVFFILSGSQRVLAIWSMFDVEKRKNGNVYIIIYIYIYSTSKFFIFSEKDDISPYNTQYNAKQ